jgi:hypothetical protein
MDLNVRSRRSGFEAGVDIRLSDGAVWTLPVPSQIDAEYHALIAAVREAEDHAEGLRAELALTIFLLDRNYQLEPEELSSLLSFAPHDPALTTLQGAVKDVVRKVVARGSVPAAPLGKAGQALATSPAHACSSFSDRVRSICGKKDSELTP